MYIIVILLLLYTNTKSRHATDDRTSSVPAVHESSVDVQSNVAYDNISDDKISSTADVYENVTTDL